MLKEEKERAEKKGKYMQIILDAGHGGFDNGAMTTTRKEKDDALRLTLAVGERLQEDGYQVGYTRTGDVYQSPFEKAQRANESGADYFISFHRNDSLEDNQYHGIQSLVFREDSKASDLAQNINRQLEKVGFTDLGIEERPGLVVLRRTEMPAVLVEAGFINSDIDNKIFDEKFSEMVDAIVRGIEETIPLQRQTSKDETKAEAAQIPEETTEELVIEHEMKMIEDTDMDEKQQMQKKPVYAVQTGLFRYRNNALDQAGQLRRDGFTPEVGMTAPFYSVFVRSSGGMEEAQRLQAQLRRKDYDTLIIEKEE